MAGGRCRDCSAREGVSRFSFESRVPILQMTVPNDLPAFVSILFESVTAAGKPSMGTAAAIVTVVSRVLRVDDGLSEPPSTSIALIVAGDSDSESKGEGGCCVGCSSYRSLSTDISEDMVRRRVGCCRCSATTLKILT